MPPNKMPTWSVTNPFAKPKPTTPSSSQNPFDFSLAPIQRQAPTELSAPPTSPNPRPVQNSTPPQQAPPSQSFDPTAFAQSWLPILQQQQQGHLQMQREGMMAPRTRRLDMNGDDITFREPGSDFARAVEGNKLSNRIQREKDVWGTSVSAPASEGGGVDYGARAASLFAANENQRSHGMLDSSDEPQVGLTPWMQANQQTPARPDHNAPDAAWAKYHKDYANYFGNVQNARTPAGTIPGAGRPRPDKNYVPMW